MWVYDPELFNAFRCELEALTVWRYSGGTDLVISNATYDTEDRCAAIDFPSTTVCQLDTMKQNNAKISIEAQRTQSLTGRKCLKACQ